MRVLQIICFIVFLPISFACAAETNAVDPPSSPTVKFPYKLPATFVRWALITYYQRPEAENIPNRVKVLLQLAAVKLPPEEIAKNRDFLIKNEVDAEFLALFDAYVKWVVKLKNSPPEVAYDLSKTFSDDKSSQFNSWISGGLAKISADLGYMPAQFDEIQFTINIYIPRPNITKRLQIYMYRNARKTLHDFANKRYAPALFDLISRTFEGRHFPKFDAEAYYWFLKGPILSIDTSRWQDVLEEEVSQEDKALAKEWIETNRLPGIPKEWKGNPY